MRKCFHCGLTADKNEQGYYVLFASVRDIYSVCSNDCICKKCGEVANSFVDYWGAKSPRVISELRQYLCGGVELQREFSAMMNGGYFS